MLHQIGALTRPCELVVDESDSGCHRLTGGGDTGLIEGDASDAHVNEGVKFGPTHRVYLTLCNIAQSVERRGRCDNGGCRAHHPLAGPGVTICFPLSAALLAGGVCAIGDNDDVLPDFNIAERVSAASHMGKVTVLDPTDS
jgi:hypothetical protein